QLVDQGAELLACRRDQRAVLMLESEPELRDRLGELRARRTGELDMKGVGAREDRGVGQRVARMKLEPRHRLARLLELARREPVAAALDHQGLGLARALDGHVDLEDAVEIVGEAHADGLLSGGLWREATDRVGA